MDISSFTSQNKRTRSYAASTRSLGSVTLKRWQPKSPKVLAARPQLSVVNAVNAVNAVSAPSQVELDTLLRQKALAKAQAGQHEEAIALFTQLIDRHPFNAGDYSNRGLTYFQSGRMAEALADYNRAIDLNPRLDGAYNNRANYHAAQGQFLEAILDYDIALDLNPTNVRAWINQGITFRDLEMYERALESLEMALLQGRLEGHIYAERGRTYHLRGDWNCAIADYQRALNTPPTSRAAERLCTQVERWMDELLEPLS